MNAKHDLDAYDYSLLSVLELDSSISLSQIAKNIRKSREFCDFRLKRLKEKSIISNNQAIINSKKIGYQTYNFLFQMQDISNSKLKEFENFLTSSSYTKYVSMTSGSWDYEVSVLVKNLDELNIFLNNLNSKFGKHIKNNNFHLRSKTLYVGSFLKALGKQKEIKIKKIKKKTKESTYNLDELDYKILNLYSVDANLSIKKLANLLGTTFNKIRYRIQQLKNNNIIMYFKMNINPTYFNYHIYSLSIKLKGYDINKEKALINFLKQNNKSFFGIKIIGNWDYRIEIIGKSHTDLKEFIFDLKEILGDNLMYYNFALQLEQLKRVSFTNNSN